MSHSKNVWDCRMLKFYLELVCSFDFIGKLSSKRKPLGPIGSGSWPYQNFRASRTRLLMMPQSPKNLLPVTCYLENHDWQNYTDYNLHYGGNWNAHCSGCYSPAKIKGGCHCAAAAQQCLQRAGRRRMSLIKGNGWRKELHCVVPSPMHSCKVPDMSTGASFTTICHHRF